MRIRAGDEAVPRCVGMAIGALALALTLLSCGTPAARIAGTETPDLNGIWQAVNAANWDIEDHAPKPGLPELGAIGAVPPGLGVVQGQGIPYQAWAASKKGENFERRRTEDPEAKCYMPGVPRFVYLPYPFQIVQSDKYIMMASEYAATVRTIHMSSADPAPIDTWMGRSNGRWQGQTLVVDVTGLNGQSWFDRAGNFASDKLHVVERYTPIDSSHLMYDATIEDPQVFTRPWNISMTLYRRIEKDAKLLEFKCVPFAEDLLYGHLRSKQPTK